MKLGKTLVAKLMAMVMALIMVFCIAGCSLNVADPVVAKVGDIEIYSSDYSGLFQSYYYYATFFGYNLQTADGLHDYQDWVLDTLIQNAVLLYKARQEGFEFSEAELLLIQEDADESYSDALATYESQIDSTLDDEAEIAAAEEALLVAALEQNGRTLTEFKDSLYDEAYDNALSKKLQDQLKSAAVVEEAEIKAEYDKLLEEQKEAYDKTPASFYTAFANYINTPATYDQPLYAPAGYIAVKHILIKITDPDESSATVEDDTKDYDAIFAEIEEKIAEIEAGTSSLTFDDLIELYNEDEGLEKEPYSEIGYYVHEDIIDKYSEPFAETALALEEVGDISERITTEHGHHYIQLIARYDEGTVIEPYVEGFESIHDKLYEDAGNELIQAFIDHQMTIIPIRRYTSRIRVYA